MCKSSGEKIVIERTEKVREKTTKKFLSNTSEEQYARPVVFIM